MRNSVLTWILLIVMFVGIYSLLNHQADRDVEIPISEFMNNIEDGLISKVTIRGDTVRGYKSGVYVTSYSTEHTELIKVMREKHIIYEEKSASSNSGWFSIFVSFGPILLLVILFFVYMRSAAKGQTGFHRNQVMSKGKLQRDIKTRFSDVAGIPEALEEVRDIVDFLRDPKKFSRLGGRIPRGVLLVGEPGCGKTLLARAVAGEAGVPFFTENASDFLEMFVGVGAARVRDLFENAKKVSPCIIFIDEIDAVGKKRGGGIATHDERDQTLNQILAEIDGFENNHGIIVIAATNRLDVLDPALLRPGRFDRKVMVTPPDLTGRKAILEVHAKNKTLAPNVNLEIIARSTIGMSGANLEALLNEAAIEAVKRRKDEIGMDEIEFARDKITIGPERKSIVLSEKEKKTTAYHEAGHVLVAWFTPGSDPVHKVTIVPRGNALGLTHTLPIGDHKSISKSELLAKVKMLLGGRAGEAMLHDDITTGASNDLDRATEIIVRMVTSLGMSEKVGLRTFPQESEFFMSTPQRAYSEDTAKRIDEEVSETFATCYKQVQDLLSQKKGYLDTLAQMLIKMETLTAQQIEAIIGPPTVA